MMKSLLGLFSLVMLLCNLQMTSSQNILPVYHQEHTIDKYLYQSALPALSEFTICFWLNVPSTDDHRNDYLVSVALPGSTNELVIGVDRSGQMTMWVRGKETQLAARDSNVDDFFTGWHKHCFTFKAGREYKWYVDRHGRGNLELVASATASSQTVRAGGHMILLQEQDGVGSRLDVSQTVPGKLAAFNFWNYEMSAGRISIDSCGSGANGNVANSNTLLEKGESVRSHHHFPECPSGSTVYVQERTTNKYLYQTGLPAMSEMSVCFWMKANEGDDLLDDYIVSIAHENRAHGNEFLIGMHKSTGKLQFVVRNSFRSLPVARETVSKLFLKWHKHCMTWKAGGHFKWYSDMWVHGHLELIGSHPALSTTIRGDSYLMLLQDQDQVGGGLDINQMTPGKIAEFNMWNREMSLHNLNRMTCGVSGNIVSMKTLKEKGKSKRERLSFHC